MNHPVHRLSAEDFEEAMAFLDRVFGEYGPHDFRQMLPSVYQPTNESMSNNLGICHRGQLAALVGVFPATWQVGNSSLKLARIGGVAVDGALRGQGLMRELMHAACELIAAEGYDLAFLGGRRSLYARFGFERAGTEVKWHMSGHDLRTRIRTCAEPTLSLGEPAVGEMDQLVALSAALPLHCVRNSERFHEHLVAWHHQPRVARDASGNVIGYLTGSRSCNCVSELAAGESRTALAMLAQWAEGGDCCLVTSALPTSDWVELERASDRVQLVDSGNWWLRDWPRVLAALLAARDRVRPLPCGRVVLGFSDGLPGLELRVDAEGTACVQTDSEPHATASSGVWLRALTGPVAASLMLDVSRASLISQFCPLPLSLSRQDQV